MKGNTPALLKRMAGRRDRILNPIKRSCAMKMSAAQIELTLKQFQAQAIPSEHPVIRELQRLFGEHTYFLDSEGLSIVETVNEERNGDARAVVVKLANWGDGPQRNLLTHAPEVTELVIDLETDLRH